MKCTLLLSLLSCCFFCFAQQPGSLDYSFNGNGYVRTDVDGTDDIARIVRVLDNGKIICAGNSYDATSGGNDFSLVKYNSDGSIDQTFGNGGKVKTDVVNSDERITDIRALPDGKLVCVGYSFAAGNNKWILVRYHQNGMIDSTFGSNGVVLPFPSIRGNALECAILPGGKILVLGQIYQQPYYQSVLVIFNYNGSVDSTFGINGRTPIVGSFAGDNQLGCMQVLSDGKILAGGYINFSGHAADIAMARYNANGSIDSSFANNGALTLGYTYAVPLSADYIWGIHTLPDGKIIVGGTTTYLSREILLARFNSNGSVDSSFGVNGKRTHDVGTYEDRIANTYMQPDGKIVALASSRTGSATPFTYNTYIVRFNTDGNFDSTFATNGMYILCSDSTLNPANGLDIGDDRKIVVSGRSSGGVNKDFEIIRLHTGIILCGTEPADIARAICRGENYAFGGEQINAAGTYYDTTASTSNSCDDIVRLTLSVNELPQPVLQEGNNVLSVAGNFNNYSWLRNGVVLSDTTFNFVPVTNGNYRVLVTDSNGCKNTSAAITVTIVGVNEMDNSFVEVVPNPTKDIITINTNLNGIAQVSITDNLGRVIYTKQVNGLLHEQVDMNAYSNGIYQLRITDDKGLNIIKRIVKQ